MTAAPDVNKPRLEVAIVGGGIIGLMTALGLLRRGMHVKIYERAAAWHEIGAGFGFTGVARECMQRLDPRLLETLSAIAQKTSSSSHTRYWDAFNPRTKHEAADEAVSLLFQMPESSLNFWGAVRSHLLLGMAALLPEGVVEFGKPLVDYEDKPGGSDEGVALRFADGSVARAHVLIGCDGIHSTTRELLLGSTHPAARPIFSHVVAYRTMVPMAAGIAALGEDKATSACMHCGPDVNMMSYPVMNGALLNVAIFAHEPRYFPEASGMTAPATRDEVESAVSALGPHVGEIAKLFPAEMVKWGIFDMYEHPAPTYARGLVCIAGDAAHASSPHQGVGACMGVEDALVLCEVLDTAQTEIALHVGDREHKDEGQGQGKVAGARRLTVERALRAFSRSRKDRSQWLVSSSREMGDMYQWRLGSTGRDPDRCHSKLDQASRKLWDFSVDAMVAGAKEDAAAAA
ncbi:hypothetical protein INS49_009972 [Diaporthe citri]|uniref:uncharacterized protein n=1 Tax=Diaporthe citri TaxID=83186 RepID=UPI001C7F7C67|nr:uncharacterized protein INS49_009972 [Diaporthe citri]KAG6361744.1 hypothetical protein INS49_009972 [Diaporthe citri]